MGRLSVLGLFAKRGVGASHRSTQVTQIISQRIETPELAVRPQPKIMLRVSDKLPGFRKLTAGRVQLPKLQTSAKREEILAKLKTAGDVSPLISTNWHGKDYVLATADIHYNPILNQLVYNVVEPILSDDLKDLVGKTTELLHDRLEVDFSKLQGKKELYVYLDAQVDEVWDYLGVKLSDEEAIKVKYYVYRDVVGHDKIEPLMRDPNIEDISCDGIGTPIFVFHRNPLYGSLATNIWFETKAELDSFVMKLAQKAGRTVSVASPLLDAALMDGSRLQVTYGTDIARHGSNFSIRKFFKVPLTIIDLLNYKTADALVLAYLWLAIEHQLSILISGSTAVGKTTFLNAVAQFISPAMKIVSIEDTAELQLMHTNWTPQVARAGFGPKKYGEVSMFDLLKAALRQRPDYIIVGEVRGIEANVMFQAMATGHPSLSTIHADNVNAVIDRLTTRPISLPASLLQNLDLIVFLDKTKQEGRFSRKVGQIVEIEGYDRDTDKLKTNEAFSWEPSTDTFVAKESHLLKKIAHKLGWTEDEVKNELLRRAGLLAWMFSNGRHTLKDVTKMVNMHYSDPQSLANVMAGLPVWPGKGF
jgi:archaeal flagellar protein FlaI